MSAEVDNPSGAGGVVEVDAQPPNVLILPRDVAREMDESDESLGSLGHPFDHRAPFYFGLTGALGVAVAYVIARGIADISSVLVIIGLSLFIAIGLDPILTFLTTRGVARGFAVAIVTLGFVLIIGAFVLAAVSPMTHEIQALVKNYPRYKANIAAGRGWAGKVLLSFGVATVSIIALTIYFLIALPGVRRLWLSLIPRSRRIRAGLLTDEVFGRVGGFMLGNLLTSVISGVGTYIWLLIFGVPYAVLLSLLVALLDLIPLVGSTIAGVIVTLVALTKGIPVAIATVSFYVVYRYLEDYLLNPRVMKHTVKVTPGLTIIATLIGGTLLGLIGALVAIPVAATIHLLLEEVAVPRQNQR